MERCFILGRDPQGQPRPLRVDGQGSLITDPAGSSDQEVVQPTHDDFNCNANIQVGDADVSSSNPVPTQDTWMPSLQADETANDSDKTFQVPPGQEWHIFHIWVEYTSTGTAGDRQLVVEIQNDASDVIGQVRAGSTQAASLIRSYLFAPGVADLTSFRDTDFLMTPIPPTWILPSGYKIRVYDSNSVDPGADDMIIQMLVGQRSV